MAKAPQRYAMKGPQIEPEAGHWTFEGLRTHVVDVHRLHPIEAREKGELIIPPYDTDEGTLDLEIQELAYLDANRGNASKIAGDFPEGSGERTREPLSKYFKLRPPPLTAQFNLQVEQPKIDNVLDPCRLNHEPLVRNGQELARMFEDETPGLLHRHALNCLLFDRSVSPPRQARIWMALDLTIYSALLAAWHIKWGHASGNKPDCSRVYRERPIVWETRVAEAKGRAPRFKVLYDNKLSGTGAETDEPRCPNPQFPDSMLFSPGTPRHPAYPSGHSTYSAAASRILAYFFPRRGHRVNEARRQYRCVPPLGRRSLAPGPHCRSATRKMGGRSGRRAAL